MEKEAIKLIPCMVIVAFMVVSIGFKGQATEHASNQPPSSIASPPFSEARLAWNATRNSAHQWLQKCSVAASTLLEEAERRKKADVIDRYLANRGSPLEGYGYLFIALGEETGINPYLPVAIAGKESYFGRYCFAPHNAWGMLAYPEGFSSWEEGIRANFDWLAKYYGCPQTAYDCPGYCVPNHPWMEDVQAIIREMGGVDDAQTNKT